MIMDPEERPHRKNAMASELADCSVSNRSTHHRLDMMSSVAAAINGLKTRFGVMHVGLAILRLGHA